MLTIAMLVGRNQVVNGNFLNMEWTAKELVLLLLLTFVIVPIVIEGLLHDLLFLIFQNSLYSGTMTGLAMALVFTLAVYLVALKPYNKKWDEVGVKPFPKHYLKSIIIWTLLNIVLGIIVVALMSLIGVGVENEKTQSLREEVTWFTFSIGFISAAIISPIYEEIFYRGFLYKWFRSKWGVAAGMFFSSLVFTLVHIPTYNTLPINFISGLIFAWTYEKTGSIIPAIIIHGTFNGLGVILTVI